MFTKPAVNHGKYTNEHTGSGKSVDHQGNLFLWGTSLGVERDDRKLFCMRDVAIDGGDGEVIEDVKSYEEAFAKVKASDNSETAWVWYPTTKQLIEKPASAKTGLWSTGKSTCMFMWADEVVTPERLDAIHAYQPYLKHATYPNGREGQHTWTQSRRMARENGGHLVTVKEAKEYIKKRGPLVFGQASWVATEEANQEKNWVSCGEKNPEGLGVDHLTHHKSYPAWAENLDWKLNDDIQCDWAGQVVIYKPLPYHETLKKGPRRFKMTLKSHDGQALVKTEKEYMHQEIPVDWFTVGDRKNAIEVVMDRHKDGVFMRLDHRADEGALDCSSGKYHEGNEVVAWKCHRGQNQWFIVNFDHTITPTCAPNMCMGFRDGKIILVKREVSSQNDERLFFDALEPTIVPCQVMPMILKSHPGKAVVVKKGEVRQHGHGMEQFIKLGDEKDAMSIFMDEDNHMHNADVPFQTFDGYQHHHRDLELFTKHVDYGHHKYKPQEDGTILFLHDPEYVLGTDEKAERVMHVEKNSPHKFVFRDIQEMI